MRKIGYKCSVITKNANNNKNMTKFLSLPQRELESGFHSKQQGCQGLVKMIVQGLRDNASGWV